MRLGGATHEECILEYAPSCVRVNTIQNEVRADGTCIPKSHGPAPLQVASEGVQAARLAHEANASSATKAEHGTANARCERDQEPASTSHGRLRREHREHDGDVVNHGAEKAHPDVRRCRAEPAVRGPRRELEVTARAEPSTTT